MRVLFLITDLELGGSPLMLRGLARQLVAMGDVEPVVVSIAPAGEVGEMMRRDGVRVESLEVGGVRQLVTAVSRWLKVVDQVRPDLICSILVHANVIAALGRVFGGDGVRGIPHVQSIHTMQRRPRWHWWAQAVAGRWADAVVVPTGAILRRMEGYGAFKRGTVIANGVDLGRFKNAMAIDPTSRPFPVGRRVVGYVGRFDPVKRLDTLIDAFGWIKNHNPLLYSKLQLVFVGYGSEEKVLRGRMLKWDICDRVTFAGATQVPERWYKCFDCYCLPSDAEGFGLTLVEAMAAGVPIVAAKTPVSTEIVDLWGYLVPAGQSESLAIAIQEVIAKREVNPGFGQLPSGALERFSEEKMAKAYFVFFELLLKSATTIPSGAS